ncbi:endonuclease/exonuclease/phosphatase family protein [Nocardioides sp.]|uniref:endonuclease/exonuclease/phosphatase family protein n=1 Tax=Nocardioides sp. TaxID=35761 RepID=UPI00273603B3|nr:endonuclease/exonuclease/phosphatase family protein [Nocardioides sp.]MDP3893272.1 endonuclease/exonuclease/phosphatase family protein [Nocardioides sp.]
MNDEHTAAGPVGAEPLNGTPSRRTQVLSTVAAVVAIGLIILVAQLATSPEPVPTGPQPAAIPDGPDAQELASTSPDVLTEDAVDARPPVAPPKGAAELRDAAEAAAALQPFAFTITTFNILGSNHTVPGGTAPGYAPGRIRTEWAANLLRGQGPDIVGFQELQGDQLATIQRTLGEDYVVYTPSGTGTVQTSLLWKRSVWEATWLSALTSPFMGGNRTRPMVRLRHLATGREIYVLNVHNSPRDAQGRQGERDAAVRIQIDAITTLRQDRIPVFFMGDMNEKETVFCKVTTQTDLVSSSGGSTGSPCRPPAGMRIDWIFGSPDAVFTSHRADRSPQVARITDHAVITAGVSVP